MGKRRSWNTLSDQYKQRIERRIRGAAVRIMNDLAELGPDYHGVFKDSWEAVPLVAASGGNFTGFPYNTSSVPRLTITNQDLRSSSLKVYDIVNGADYALIAMDLEPGEFEAQPDEPNKEPVARGTRYGGAIFDPDTGEATGLESGFRWMVTDGTGGNAISTAERDWYANYIYGGGLEKAMRDDRPITGISLELAR